MDFSWTKKQIELKENVIHFAQNLFRENLVELDQQEEFNLEGWKRCGQWSNPIDGLFVGFHTRLEINFQANSQSLLK